MKLSFDSGIKEYEINSGVLRFNPSDPNVYGRFLTAAEKIKSVEDSMIASGANAKTGEDVIRLMVEADRKVKDILRDVFGRDNDFDPIFDGVNIMAVASNGETVIANFIEAISPILEEGAKKCAQQKVDSAMEEANRRRAQRGEM